MRRPLGIIIVVAAVALAGCSKKGLMDIRPTGNGPDEFLILPAKPLTAPSDYSKLPEPTPGQANLTDLNPEADAMAALGGRATSGIPAADGALVTAASRNGVEPGVRETLAAEDAKFRKRQSRMTRLRLFPVDRYSQAYRRQEIDPFKEAEKYRRAGVGTPSSPPETIKK
ncbi:DUF3035 domain-containing protein [Pseudodonghicola xiamenensis]|uniref:Beta-barrel assembly machine subunit BamF n=1 Tax=Pseudodonghicola xiamenensis TaxID=337702 RepID=A0A8J3H5D5_9RHOB|nr:DUF3035 domain-containing protein [Pseudodonghicola xiamenensis]GHG82101.1 hypothetical protein GCM10010961_06330 [Pseudodonghicola xiamenensis]